MPDAPELPPRPAPPRRRADVVSAWVRWIGFGRLAGSAVSVVLVVGGALWLLRSSPPPAESALPMSTGSTPVATLSVPTTDVVQPTASTAAVPQVIVVHVAGAVAGPGVYSLSSAIRVADAVAASGGATSDADLDALNLAAPIVDGERIYVPRLGEVDPASVATGASETNASLDTGQAAPAGPIDLNTATAADLETLPGVGPSTAAAIVDDRTNNGPFASVDDLDRVAGIGPSKLAALRDHVTV